MPPVPRPTPPVLPWPWASATGRGTLGATADQDFGAGAGGPPEPALALGLRDRKKALTRQYISDVGTHLFLEHGFETVTVAEIAAAAEVSVKTIFNYFGSKEELLLDREEEIVGSLDALAATRDPSVGLVPMLIADVAVRFPAIEIGRWSHLSEASLPYRRRFTELIDESPVLRGRWLMTADRLRDRTVALAAADLGLPTTSPEAIAAGELLNAAYTSAGQASTRALRSGASVTEVVAAAVGTAMEALGRVEAAYQGTPLVDGPAR